MHRVLNFKDIGGINIQEEVHPVLPTNGPFKGHQYFQKESYLVVHHKYIYKYIDIYILPGY